MKGKAVGCERYQCRTESESTQHDGQDAVQISPLTAHFQTAVLQGELGPQALGLFVRNENAHSKFKHSRFDRHPYLIKHLAQAPVQDPAGNGKTGSGIGNTC